MSSTARPQRRCRPARGRRRSSPMDWQPMPSSQSRKGRSGGSRPQGKRASRRSSEAILSTRAPWKSAAAATLRTRSPGRAARSECALRTRCTAPSAPGLRAGLSAALRASNQAPRAVGAQLRAPLKPRVRKQCWMRWHSRRMPPNRRRLAPTSSSRVDSSAAVTCGVNCSMAIATASSASSSRCGARSSAWASGASISAPPRRMPVRTPAARATGEAAMTRSWSSTTVPGSADQRGQKTSSGSRGRCRPIHKRMTLQ